MIPRILIADDEPRILALLKQFLKDEPWIVETALSGQEAHDLLMQKHVHVAILDLSMPEMNGFSVLQSVRDAGRTTQIIMLTAYGNVNTAVQAMKLGAAEFLEKPVEQSALIATINRYLPPMPGVWASRFDAYLSEHYANPDLSQADLIRHFNVSRTLIYNVFKEQWGVSFQKRLRQIRIERAKEWLYCTQHAIHAIATACGFKSIQRLNDAFRAEEKLSPSEYRKQAWERANLDVVRDFSPKSQNK